MTRKLYYVYLSSISESNLTSVDCVYESAKSLARYGKVIHWSLIWEQSSSFTDIVKRLANVIRNIRLLSQNNTESFIDWRSFIFPILGYGFLLRLNALIIKTVIRDCDIVLICTCAFPEVLAIQKIFNPILTAIDRVDIWKKDEFQLIKNNIDLIFSNSTVIYDSQNETISKPVLLCPEGFVLRDTLTSLHNHLVERRNKQITVLYSGTMTWRMNCDLFLYLMKKMPQYQFLFIGPLMFNVDVNPDWISLNNESWMKWNEMSKLSNFKYVSVNTQRDLIGMYIRADIGIIPYDIRYPFSRYCHPIKLYHYFALGIPVVSSPIPSIMRYASKAVRIARTPENYVRQIRKISARKISQYERKTYLSIALDNTYDQKSKFIENSITRQLRRFDCSEQISKY